MIFQFCVSPKVFDDIHCLVSHYLERASPLSLGQVEPSNTYPFASNKNADGGGISFVEVSMIGERESV